MAQVHCQLDDVTPDSFEVVPPGDYQVRVVDSKVSTSKNGNPMAEFQLEIEAPSNIGRKLFERFTLNHDVGRKRLKGFLMALGHRNPAYLADTEEAHGLTAIAKVAIEQDKAGVFDDKNVVKSYKPLNGQVAPGNPQAGILNRPTPLPSSAPGGVNAQPSPAPGLPLGNPGSAAAPTQTPPPWAA